MVLISVKMMILKGEDARESRSWVLRVNEDDMSVQIHTAIHIVSICSSYVILGFYPYVLGLSVCLP